MAIPIPVTRSKIATVPWGIPITNEVNRLTTAVATLQVGQWNPIITFLNGWSNFDGPAPAGRYLKWRREANGVIRWTGVLRVPGGTLNAITTICSIPVPAYSSGGPTFTAVHQTGVGAIELLGGNSLSAQPLTGALTNYLFAELSYAAAV